MGPTNRHRSSPQIQNASGPERVSRTVPHRHDGADAEQAKADAPADRVPLRWFRDGSDRRPGRDLRVQTRSTGVCILHVAQGPDRDRRPGSADGCPAGRRGHARAEAPGAGTRARVWPVAVGRDSGRPGDRPTVPRLPGGTGRHRRFRRRPLDPGRGAAGVQRRRVRARGASARGLPVGASKDAGVHDRAQRLDPVAWPPGVAAVLVGVGCVLLAAGIAGL